MGKSIDYEDGKLIWKDVTDTPSDLLSEAHDKAYEAYTLIGDALESLNAQFYHDYTQDIEELHDLADELQAGLYDLIEQIKQ